MKKIIPLAIIYMLFFGQGFAFSQEAHYGSYYISFRPGFNSLFIPSRDNEIIDNEPDFTSKSAHTLGIQGKIEAWPLHFQNFGYGYSYELSKGWLFVHTHAANEHGHNFYAGFKSIQFHLKVYKLKRESFGMTKKYKSYDDLDESISRSLYDNISRWDMGLRFKLNEEFLLHLSYLIENYDELPSDEWSESAHGFQASLYKFNSFNLKAEAIINHPMYGVYGFDAPLPGMNDLEKESTFVKISITKCFDFRGRKYMDVINDLFPGN